MGQRHKHADAIIAWAEGKDVQVWDEGAKCWCDLTVETPAFKGDKYRIKPPTKKCRVALFKINSGSYALAINSQDYADTVEQREDFVRWLTDWIEYEE